MRNNSRFQENDSNRAAGHNEAVSAKRLQDERDPGRSNPHDPPAPTICHEGYSPEQGHSNLTFSSGFQSFQPSTRNAMMVVEQQTLRSSSSLVAAGSSSWRARNHGDAERGFQFPVDVHEVRGRESHVRVDEHVVENTGHNFSSNSNLQSLDRDRSKVVPAPGFLQFLEKSTPKEVVPESGFLQFLEKSIAKEKDVSFKNQPTYGSVGGAGHNRSGEEPRANLDLSLTQKYSDKDDCRRTLYEGCSKDTRASASLHVGGVSLRDWIGSSCKKINRNERMNIFLKILSILDFYHSHRYALAHMSPSYFVILPSNQVKYIGSFIYDGRIVEASDLIDQQAYEHGNEQLNQTRDMEQDTENHEDRVQKYQKLAHDSSIGVGYHSYPPRQGHQHNNQMQDDKVYHSKGRNCGVGASRIMGNKQYTSFGSPNIHNITSSTSRMPESMMLEERWYADPDNGGCPFTSNIYSLGVFLFELFCRFETWELHCADMSNLRHRILPQNFMSECPRESSFCLRLMHPHLSSRLKFREIMSGLFRKIKDSSLLNDSLPRIKEEHEQAELLLHCLSALKEQKEKQAAKLLSDLDIVQADILQVERKHKLRTMFLSAQRDFRNPSNMQDDRNPVVHVEKAAEFSNSFEERLMQNIEPLQNVYFSMRSRTEPSKSSSTTRSDNDVLRDRERSHQVHNDTEGRETVELVPTEIFFEDLCKFACYNRFEVCGSMTNIDLIGTSKIISSISFDRDEDYFATAGVSKKIKIFEYESLLNDNVDIHYPLVELSNKSKVSSVCWNSYIKSYLASADHQGLVQVWDASTGQALQQFQEHQKRTWSVDFSQVDPIKLVSGSDDYSVKLWSINQRKSIDTIRAGGNALCTQLSPHSSHMLVFCTANWKIYCYDLRHTRVPWCTLVGHEKATSYVRFLDASTLVSASIDNTLRVWDLNRTSATEKSTDACSLTLTGHTNKKHFVGLSVSNGYISCGSETNEGF